MPSTITIQMTINWELGLLEQQPVLINGLDPAISAAQLVLETVLGAPFSWPWNRGIITYSSAAQDNTLAVPNFGFCEGGSLVPTGGGKSWALAVKHFLEVDSSSARPQWVGPWIDDGAGNITFRSMPSPDQSYNYTLPFQKKAPIIYSVAQTWAPVPDDKVYMCQWGHLSLMSLIGNDARFNEYNQKFITSLLSSHGALTDLERNIFLGNWLRAQSQQQAAGLAVQERYKAREV
jgi:hypothetical protein